ncbi:response regulator transcription factor [Opitutus sp. ER46]|uniref:response regulator transcription factor n=1 Tax=Opitutus sp. ER46 TaxID=2161864 RepID=UPI000D2F7CC5|nr:response regulator transcription factor [Opitutus sp. ER46]PTY01101.1 DNA-binding response regulator [Opitutus sp. ER46]
MKPKILVVDDEPDALEVLGFKLKEAGYAPIFAKDGSRAITAARDEHPDLIVLDLMLPEVDGLEVCKVLRRDNTTAGIPIVMLTARAAEMDRVIGLELGADDYVTKPFSPRELVLRIKKLLARAPAADTAAALIRFGDLAIDVPRHEVRWRDEPIALTATEFKLLQVLAQRRGRVQTRDRLLQDVWGYENPIDSRTVDTHMRRLREKLGDAAQYLETIRGVGYRFIATE